jgi:hypothetical protein
VRSPRCAECGTNVDVDRAGLVMLHTVAIIASGNKTAEICPGSKGRPLMLGLTPRAERRRRMGAT